MRNLAVLLGVMALAAGVLLAFDRLTRPALPEPPAIPADVADPAILELWQERRAGVVADPRNAEAWGRYGTALDAHQRGDDAEACYQVATRLAPGDVRWHYFLARRLRETRPDAAIDRLQQARTLTAATPEEQAVLDLTLAELLADEGRADEAGTLARAVLAADPQNPWVRFLVGVAELDANDPAGVRRLVGLAQNPAGQRKSAALLAAYHRRAGNLAEADGFEYAASLLPRDLPWPNPFEQVISDDLRGERSLVELEARQGERGDHHAALKTAQALADQYSSARTQLVLGRAMVQAGDPAGAVAVLTDATRADPDLTMAHAFLGVAKFQLAERAARDTPAESKRLYEESVRAIDRAVALKSDYAPGYYYRAQALARLDRRQEALTAIREFLTRRPEEWEGHLVEADLLAQFGDREAALKATREAVKLAHPAEPRPKAALAKLEAAGAKK